MAPNSPQSLYGVGSTMHRRIVVIGLSLSGMALVLGSVILGSCRRVISPSIRELRDDEARRTFEMVAGKKLPPLAEKRRFSRSIRLHDPYRFGEGHSVHVRNASGLR